MSYDKFKSISSGAPNILLMNILDSYKRGSERYPEGYETSCVLLFGLEKFLYGFGEGIEDFPPPPNPKTVLVSDAKTRINEPFRYLRECKNYFIEHFPTVMQRTGQYEQEVLKSLSMRANFGGMPDTEV